MKVQNCMLISASNSTTFVDDFFFDSPSDARWSFAEKLLIRGIGVSLSNDRNLCTCSRLNPKEHWLPKFMWTRLERGNDLIQLFPSRELWIRQKPDGNVIDDAICLRECSPLLPLSIKWSEDCIFSQEITVSLEFACALFGARQVNIRLKAPDRLKPDKCECLPIAGVSPALASKEALAFNCTPLTLHQS